ncbi:MAG: hypothetical protein QOH95_859 [Gaiellaceae bacterium]|jgi:hypothetical protein|nr:hypothetical protein [Gaiellaceae bacterium]
MNGSELLHEAGALVASGWCQGAEARTLAGEAVEASDESAVSWSLLGALQAAAVSDDSTRMEDIGVAVAAIAELIVDPSLAHWNDVPTRTQSVVAELLDRAESLAEDALSADLAITD